MTDRQIHEQLREQFYAAHSRMACLLQAVLGRLLTVEEQDATYKFLMDQGVLSSEDARRGAAELSCRLKHGALN